MTEPQRGFSAVLRNGSFLRLWLAQVFSQVAQNGANLVQIVLIETLTHSSGQIALMVLAFTLPGAFLSILAGVVVDRVSNRRILIASNALRVALTLGYLAAFHWLGDWSALIVIYLLTFFTSAVGQFFAPAEAATIPALVERHDLLSANALFNVTMTLSQLVGLVLLFPLVLKFGASLSPTGGLDLSFFLIAAMYLLATLLVALLPADARPFHPARMASAGQALRDIREGWQFVRRTPAIYLPMLHMAMMAMLVMVMVTVGPGFANRVLGLPPEDAIFIFAPAGVGMLACTYLIGRFGHGWNRDRVAGAGEIALGVTLLALAATGWYAGEAQARGHALGVGILPIVMSLSFVLGLSVALIAIPSQTSLQERSPANLRGRVFALLYTVTSLVVIIPLLFLGALADRIGIPAVVGLVSLSAFAVGAFCLVRLRNLPAAQALESVP